jgi:hypothetical protein
VIREAFEAAKGAGAKRLNWVLQRLERGRDSPGPVSRLEEQDRRNREASREFVALAGGG